MSKWLRAALASMQLVSALSAATVGIVRPQFAPLVGSSLGPWAQQAAAALDAAASPARAMADSFIGSGTLTITKQVNGAVPGQTYQVTVAGPSFTAPSTTLFTAGETKVITGLLSGVYTVTFTPPSGYSFTTRGNDPASNTDSNANPTTGAAAPVTLTPGVFNPTIDAGLVQLSGLGDRVWYDTDHDGMQDTGEPGVPGMTVTLMLPTVPPTAQTTQTDAGGNYSFTNLLPNVVHTVTFAVPEGYTFTLPTVGDPTADSDANPNTGVTTATLAPGEYDPTVDAGLWMPLPTLVVTKRAQIVGNAVTTGDLITYVIVTRNDGPGVANSLTISDPLPNALAYVAGSGVPAPQVSGQMLMWTKADLKVGEVYTVSFVARVRPDPSTNATQIMNVGYAFAFGPDKRLVNLPGSPLADDGQAGVQFVPTAVTLVLFEAKWQTAGVHVNWETGSEIDTFGFALYRSVGSVAGSTRASAVQVTPQLIPSKSVNNGGASYAFVDTTAQPGVTYTYWLQETETTGKLNEYGPVDTEGVKIHQPKRDTLYLPALMR